MSNLRVKEVRATLRGFSDELKAAEAGANTDDVKALTLRIRREILTIQVNHRPLLDEARCFAELLNRLSRLKRCVR
ncbi:hypothetical protein [Sutterella sp.]|uniref:hypothetical protein n=1 Tax=Sutterella sp. TaxID=1981025 RepID=UPI003FD6D2B1